MLFRSANVELARRPAAQYRDREYASKAWFPLHCFMEQYILVCTIFLGLTPVYIYTICIMDSKSIIKVLKADGWEQVKRRATSHIQFTHPTKKGRVTVPHPKRDLAIGTVKSIEKQARLKLQ